MTRLRYWAIIVAVTAVVHVQAVRDTGGGDLCVTVVDQDGTPVPRARVYLDVRPYASTVEKSTDDDGRVDFAGVPSTPFEIRVEKPAYIDTVYGRLLGLDRGRLVAVAAGQRRAVVVTMPRGAVIAGMVMNADGEPAAAATVTARRWRSEEGRTVLSDLGGLTVQSDPFGRYRFFELRSGTYVVTASAEALWADEGARRLGDGSAALVRVDEFGSMPGVVDANQRNGVTVGAGERHEGVNIVMKRRVRQMATIEASVDQPCDDEVGQSLMLVQYRDPAGVDESSDRRMWPTQENGRFVFRNLLPGRYFASYDYSGCGKGRSGDALVEIQGAGVVPISLTPNSSASVSGKLVVESPQGVVTPRIRLDLDGEHSLNDAGPSFRIQDGAFDFIGVAPDRYVIGLLESIAGTSWHIRSVVVDGAETIDGALEVRAGQQIRDVIVTVADNRRLATLAGDVELPVGVSAASAVVVAFPSDRRYWTPGSRRVRVTLIDDDKSFKIAGLPEGKYLAALVINPPVDQGWDVALLERLEPGAGVVELGPGQITTVRLERRRSATQSLRANPPTPRPPRASSPQTDASRPR
ncbi:MAG TPA: carboxypeptidase-like regulatory domain-containing protein [Vicinamibacterales bacterium]|nr:carboxypeptidase-like regulatory domain-containing protein [Vicinamibacterales bacterium]